MLHIPKNADAQVTLLHVEAEVRLLTSSCMDMYFQVLNVTGAWAEAKQKGGLHFQAGETDSKEKSKWMSLGRVELKVVHGHTQEGLHYLNVFVRHLRRTGLVIGGLLGEDDHSQAAMSDPKCVRRRAIQLMSVAIQ